MDEYSISNITSYNDINVSTVNSTDFDSYDNMSHIWSIMEYTNYLFYSLIFFVGIIGNIVVIYVILSPICCNNRSNRDHFGNNQAHFIANHNTNTMYQNSPGPRRKSVRTRSVNSGSSFRKPNRNPNNINNEDVLNAENKLLKIADSEPHKIDLVLQQSSFAEETKCFNCQRVRSFFKHLIVEKLSTTNFYLFNLAVTDFMYLATIPIVICTIHFKQWVFGSIICKAYMSGIYAIQSTSAFILVVLSVDRYLSVMYPHKVTSFRNTEVARIVISVVWFLTFVLVTPVIIYTKRLDDDGESGYRCATEWPPAWNFKDNTTYLSEFLNTYMSPPLAFQIYIFFFNYLIPVTIIAILYFNIIRKLHRKSKIKKSKTKTKSHRKITRMVLYIVISYMMCWTPYWSLQMFNYFLHIKAFGEYEPDITYILMVNFISIIAYLSSALNPFIYSYMSESFRASLKSELNKCCCWSDSSTAEVTTLAEMLPQQLSPNASILSRSKGWRHSMRASFRSFRSESPTDQHQSKMLTSYFVQNKQKLKNSITSNNSEARNLQLGDLERTGSLNSGTQQISFAEPSEETKKQSIQFQLDTHTKRDSVISSHIKEEGEEESVVLTQIATNSETTTNTTKNITLSASPVLTIKTPKNDEIKTYVYRTKSNFAFAINFHSLSAKKNLIRGIKLRGKNNRKSSLGQHGRNRDKKHVKFIKFDQVKHHSNDQLNEVV